MQNKTATKIWEKNKKKLLDKCSVFSANGIIYERGEEEELISYLQEKLEKSREEIKGLLEKL